MEVEGKCTSIQRPFLGPPLSPGGIAVRRLVIPIKGAPMDFQVATGCPLSVP